MCTTPSGDFVSFKHFHNFRTFVWSLFHLRGGGGGGGGGGAERDIFLHQYINTWINLELRCVMGVV